MSFPPGLWRCVLYKERLTPIAALVLFFSFPSTTVLNPFGTRDWCHGRQFFRRPGWGRFGVIQAHGIYCALDFYYQPRLRSSGVRSQRLGAPALKQASWCSGAWGGVAGKCFPGDVTCQSLSKSSAGDSGGGGQGAAQTTRAAVGRPWDRTGLVT